MEKQQKKAEDPRGYSAEGGRRWGDSGAARGHTYATHFDCRLFYFIIFDRVPPSAVHR